jgi:hypothetical protein
MYFFEVSVESFGRSKVLIAAFLPAEIAGPMRGGLYLQMTW